MNDRRAFARDIYPVGTGCYDPKKKKRGVAHEESREDDGVCVWARAMIYAFTAGVSI